MAASNRNAIIDPTTGHRIDPLTQIDIDKAVADGDNVALTNIEIAHYEAMLVEEPGNWFAEHSLKVAKKRLQKYVELRQRSLTR